MSLPTEAEIEAYEAGVAETTRLRRDARTLEAERDRYKKALEDAKEKIERLNAILDEYQDAYEKGEG